jgi:hypothetical protein
MWQGWARGGDSRKKLSGCDTLLSNGRRVSSDEF